MKYTPDYEIGVPVILSALSINCESAVGPVTVSLTGEDIINLHDDGISPDMAAGDGIFSAEWVPLETGGEITFSSPAGTEVLPAYPMFKITTDFLPSTTIGTPYDQTPGATGGLPPYTWFIGAGYSLPPGLTLNSVTGRISGTPAAIGSYRFNLEVTDSNQSLAEKWFSVVVYESMFISTSMLPDGAVNASYHEVLTATGASPPFTWSITSGALPAGMTLNSSTGAISGSPATSGSFDFTVQVNGPNSASAEKSFSIDIHAIRIATLSLPPSVIGIPYSATLAAEGGSQPYTWSLYSGLPDGLVLNSATGEISGTPTTEGTSNFIVQVTGADGSRDTKPFSVSSHTILITPSLLPSGAVNTAYSQTLSASGGLAPYTWSVISGSLPDGLTLNSATGQISGVPTMIGLFNVTVEVRGTALTQETASFSIRVWSAHSHSVCSSGCDFSSIQTAINASSPGDTINVLPGIYLENLGISKSVNLVGAGSEVTIVNALYANKFTFDITASNVTVRGFHAKGSVGSSDNLCYNDGWTVISCSGFVLRWVENCVLSNNTVSGNHQGINLLYADNNTIEENIITSNNNYGIYFYSSVNNIFEGNTITANVGYGMLSWMGSDGNRISGNTVSKHNSGGSGTGIALNSNSTGNTILGNICNSNGSFEIFLNTSHNSTVLNNVTNSNGTGIGVWIYATQGLVSNNSSSGNTAGMYFLSNSANTIKNNMIFDNTYGIRFYDERALNNVFYNNYFSNPTNVFYDSGNSANTWNTDKLAGNTIVGGDYLGGNYWANPGGDGFSRDVRILTET